MTVASAGPIVRRAWPRGRDIVVELVDDDGLVRAGRGRPDGPVAVQAPGSDPDLPGLGPAVERAGGAEHVVAHRLGRRAVVRHGTTWVKVVRPPKVAAVADRHRLVAAAIAGTGVGVASLVAVDEGEGALLLGHLDGVTLLDHPDPVRAAARVDAALRAWAAGPVPATLPVHDAGAEQAVLRAWADDAMAHEVVPPTLWPALAAAVADATSALATLGARPLTLSHRDLHEAQVLVADDRVSLLDLDTAARADPALDRGNLLAHVDLAAALGTLDSGTAAAVACVLDPDHDGAVAAYRAAARARLVAVHAFRPATRAGALALLQPSGRRR